MKVIRADILGYCMGVRRAIEQAESALDSALYRHIYTYGPLIHNNVALAVLASRGISILDENRNEPHTLEGDAVIIRAHGISPSVRLKLDSLGATIIDATCPRVLASQKRAADFARKGYTIVLAGDRHHGEIVGIAGCVTANGGTCIIIENSDEAKHLKIERAVLIAQTTISRSEYEGIATVLREKCSDIVICSTICPATEERQQALNVLSSKVDAILVIGGRNSANTTRLLRTAASLCKRTALIEHENEIPKDFFDAHIGTIGLTAGASTPDFIIDKVERVLLDI